MSVNKLNVPTTDTDDTDVGESARRVGTDEKTKALNPDSSTTKNDPFQATDTVSKEFADDFSNNAQSNRLHNNANDPTDRDPTRATDKPITGKIQK